MSETLIKKIKNRNAKICVLGLGYIGLPTAAMFATNGFQVQGVDIDQDVVHTLNNGDLPIQEPGLKTVVQAAYKSGNLCVDCQVEPADVFIIAVPTPITEEKKANLDYVTSAARSIQPNLERNNLVILESTSPPRTTVDVIKPILEDSDLTAGEDFFLAYSPERVLPGKILKELVDNSRVIGGINQTSAELGKELYSSFVEGEIVMTDATTAEMVKLMENTYRDINIAIANEFSRLGEYFGINIWEAIEIANRHPRVDILNPGPGVGGHCISVDPWFLVENVPDLTPLIQQAREVNDSQPEYIVNKLAEELGGLKGKKIATLGITYKADVDDIRESPALDVINNLVNKGAEVKIYDPYVQHVDGVGEKLHDNLKGTLSGAECILLLVDHEQFKDIDVQRIASFVEERIVFDTRHVLQRDKWEAEGFNVLTLGVRD